jgi:hypothetical protein
MVICLRASQRHFAFRHRLFGGMVHRGDKVIRQLFLLHRPQRTSTFLILRHGDFDVQVREKSAVMTQTARFVAAFC